MASSILLLAATLAAVTLAGGAADPSEHPYVRTIERYLDARKKHDTAALRAILSEDSRIWFGEREGPGSPRSPEGRGPWSDWDRFFRSETEIVDYRVEGGSVRTTAVEINDWFRLVDRPASRYHITYYFDSDGRIEGTRIHSIPGTPERRDRLGEFEAWAREHRPGLLERLMPEGEIDPALDKAKLWKRSLLDWRAAVGLPDPLGDR